MSYDQPPEPMVLVEARREAAELDMLVLAVRDRLTTAEAEARKADAAVKYEIAVLGYLNRSRLRAHARVQNLIFAATGLPISSTRQQPVAGTVETTSPKSDQPS